MPSSPSLPQSVHRFLPVLLVAVASVALLGAAGRPATDRPECEDPSRVPNLSQNCPDMFAWTKFVEVNAPAPGHPDLVLWQTWATDPDTFPSKPQPGECGGDDPPPDACPVWPEPTRDDVLHLEPSKRNDDLHPPEMEARVEAMMQGSGRVPPDLGAVAGETIRRNRATFDYIVDNDLWYQEGLAARFDENFRVDFPVASIEVKLNWLDLETYGLDPARYFTVERELDGELTTLGLVAMHVSTKDLPKWFWSTFEHVDNPGRCDFIGCHDSFGVTPEEIPPRQVLKMPYPAGDLTPALETLMDDAGLNPVFKNYRLKGSQVDFTDDRGEPILLGNSVTEYGFVPTASCITCHGRAGTDMNGQKPANLRIFGEKLSGQTFNGPLDPELYYDEHDQTRRYLLQTDFVWAIPFRAQPIGGASSDDGGQ